MQNTTVTRVIRPMAARMMMPSLRRWVRRLIRGPVFAEGNRAASEPRMAHLRTRVRFLLVAKKRGNVSQVLERWRVERTMLHNNYITTTNVSTKDKSYWFKRIVRDVSNVLLKRPTKEKKTRRICLILSVCFFL